MEKVVQLFNLKEGEILEQGIAKLSVLNFNRKSMGLDYLRMLREDPIFYCSEGEYIRLFVNNQLMMSDTNMERLTNQDFVNNAKGRVMVAGLGIGLIIHNLRNKVESGEITEIVIFEKYQDVIDLVRPFYKDLPITYICQDILEYKPTKEDMFDTIYFDIWPKINTDNLVQIKKLHNTWKFRRKKPNSFMDSWMKKRLQYIVQKEKRESRYW